ncbi:MAG: hypothetical protein M3186_09905 [Actinomycetota bacterium]|nr:hypothetical protein [Actinomycetota bacterium]
MDGLCADIKRAGGAPLPWQTKTEAITAMRELTGALRAIAFQAVCNAPE